jgi:hypothetical protein
MPFDPNFCPDCSYPPNFQFTRLPKTEDGKNRTEVHCRDCNEIWVEIEDLEIQDDDA